MEMSLSQLMSTVSSRSSHHVMIHCTRVSTLYRSVCLSVSLILALSQNILSRNFSRWWMITFHLVCIFCLFLPKIVKIKPKIGNFRPKCWNLKYKVFQKICNRTSWKFNTKLGTKMQFSDALWWCHNIFKVADRHHIENSFLALSHTILAD